MFKESITSEWKCDCSTVNPLRYRVCQTCGKEIPGRITDKIYREEIRIQRQFLRNEKMDRNKRYAQRMQAWQHALMPLTCGLLIVCVGVQFRFAPQETAGNFQKYRELRIERLIGEVERTTDHLTGIKASPEIVSETLRRSQAILSDAVYVLSSVAQKPVFDVQEDKVQRIHEKMRKVMDYVTAKLK